MCIPALGIQHIRYAGTDTALVVQAGSLAAMKSAFEKAPKAQFGFIDRKTIYVEQGATLKRFTARAKGRGNRISKPTCHVYVTVGN